MRKRKGGPRPNVPDVPRSGRNLSNFVALRRWTCPVDMGVDMPADVHRLAPLTEEPIADPRLARRVLASLRAAVFEAFADALDRPTAVSMRAPAFLCWRSKTNFLEYARCEAYRLPERGDPLRPFIVRVSINDARAERLERVAREQRLASTDDVLWGRRRWRMELSMLPHETLALVPFLAGLVRAHEEGDASLIPEPAVPLLHWNSTPMAWNYAWTKEAWGVSCDYEERGRLYAPRVPSTSRASL